MTQIEFSLPAFPRGYHIVTDDVLSALGPLPEVGILNVFIKHTSAAITINESADPDVLTDFESIFNLDTKVIDLSPHDVKLLRFYYDYRLKKEMTRDEVLKVLDEIVIE